MDSMAYQTTQVIGGNMAFEGYSAGNQASWHPALCSPPQWQFKEMAPRSLRGKKGLSGLQKDVYACQREEKVLTSF